MARIVYLTNGMASTLNSSLELSRRLRAAGHEVTYVSHVDIEAAVAAEGYAFFRLTRDVQISTKLVRAQARQEHLPVIRHWISWWRLRRRVRQQSIVNNELERLTVRLAPDLLIVDLEMHDAIIATARLGIPTVLVIVWFSIFRRPGLPPLETHLAAGNTLGQRILIRLAWCRSQVTGELLLWRRRLSLQGIRDCLSPVRYGTNKLVDLKALARSRGYQLKRETTRFEWCRPITYRNLKVLSFNAWEMEFPHDRHPHLAYVGPMVHARRQEVLIDDSCGQQWRSFQQWRAGKEIRSPLIYCSLGSFWSADRGFLRQVIRVFCSRSEWDLVLGLGGKLTPDQLAPVPSNVLLLKWAPQLEVLRDADCAITHGGITSINECIFFKVPMVVYSTGHIDQNGCAARVAFHGLGMCGDHRRDGPAELERNIERALTDVEIRAKVAAMNECFRNYEHRHTAEQLIAALAGSRPTGR